MGLSSAARAGLVLLSLSGACAFTVSPAVAALGGAGSASRRSTSNGQQCRTRLAMSAAVDKDKVEVEEYFNQEGFSRWNKIYSESDDVNTVQLDIRTGHGQTIEKVLGWLDDDKSVAGNSFCDAGCGVGSLTLPLAQRGGKLFSSDISAAMTTEAEARAKASLGELAENCKFTTSDLESLSGNYDNVCCIDVMIHYPTDKMSEMVTKLCSMADKRVIISFAPDSWYYSFLKKIGEFFPGPSKTTRAYLHKEEAVTKALADAGFKVKRNSMTSTNFYYSRLLEAVKE